MKVIAFNGSPHERGVTHTGLTAAAGELVQAGIEVEIIPVGNQSIRGCTACGGCRQSKRCVQTDDMVNACRDKVNAADGIMLGSPVYYGGIAGTFKCFLDRLFFPGIDLRYKAGAVAASLRRSGGIATFQGLSNYLNLAQAVIVPSVYWNVIHGHTAEETLRDEEGQYIMRLIGRNMAWLLKTLALGKKDIPLPEQEPRIWTHFINS